MYNESHAGILRCHPDDEVLSYVRIKSKIAKLSGVSPMVHHMCINTCMAFTGPFSNLTECPTCHQARYIGETKIPRRVFHTIPIGPQLQALWRSVEGAQIMHYQIWCTATIITEIEVNGGQIAAYDDIYQSSKYLADISQGDIAQDDIILILSINGTQLYQMKASNPWISKWIIGNYLQYKKKIVLTSTFMPGLKKPKHPDRFMFPALYCLVTLQKEGHMIWDAAQDRIISLPLACYCRWSWHDISQWSSWSHGSIWLQVILSNKRTIHAKCN